MGIPFGRRKHEEELDEEIQSHLQMAIQDRIERGDSDRDALGSALREMGNVGLIKEVTKEMWGWASLERLMQDLRYGLRVLRKSPGFTFVAVLSLALGIGANTAIFSLVDKVLLRTLPVEQPERLVVLGTQLRNGIQSTFTYPDFKDYRDQNDVFDGLVCFTDTPLSLNRGAQTERIYGALVSGNYFSTLGVRPALGRGFLPDEDRTRGTHPVAVLSYHLWRNQFGSDPGVLGTSIKLNGNSFTVVGVAPFEFTGTRQGLAPDIYLPVMMVNQAQPARDNNPIDGEGARNNDWLEVMGRLKPGVSRQQAQASINVLAARIASQFQNHDGSVREAPELVVQDGRQGNTEGLEDLKFPLKILMGIVGLVLLIACANVANLLLARSSTRHKEIAIRLAIGAGRTRLIRQLLTESLLLAMLGGIVGLFLGSVIFRLFDLPTELKTVTTDNLDFRVLGFTAIVSVLTGIIFGLVPAFVGSRSDLVPALKDETNSGERAVRRLSLRNLLVIVQVALSMVVLIGAGLCVRSLQKLQSIDAGFNPARILLSSVDLGLNGYTEARGNQFYSQMLERVSALPGVESASLATATALGGSSMGWTTKVEGYQPQPKESMGFHFNVVGPNYFRTMNIPIIRGREFTEQDTDPKNIYVVINETLARKYFSGQDPIGKHLMHHVPDKENQERQEEIIGIVADSKYSSLTQQTRATMYYTINQNYQSRMTLHVRTAGNPTAMTGPIRQAVQALDPSLPIFGVRTMEQQKSNSLSTSRLAANLLTFFGLLALMLASIGMYGVMSYAVNRRTREIGIRMAIGAQKTDVFRMVISQGMILVTLGLILGTAGAMAASRYVESFLYGVSATDKWTYVVIASIMALVALLANYIPARRAIKVDPMTALRYE